MAEYFLGLMLHTGQFLAYLFFKQTLIFYILQNDIVWLYAQVFICRFCYFDGLLLPF